MIRVAFVLPVSQGWIGGFNYFLGLLNSLYLFPERKIEPVVFVPASADANQLARLPPFQIVRTRFLDNAGTLSLLPRLMVKLNLPNQWVSLVKIICLDILMIIRRIDVHSHVSYKPYSSIKAIGWIPDFQHVHLPEMFSWEEILERNHEYMYIARKCKRVILSSHDAKKDFIEFAEKYRAKARILSFVSVPDSENCSSLEELQEKYDFYGHYFYVPQQFWRHKNHSVIIQALAIIKENKCLVLASGAASDYRHPCYFQELMRLAEELDVKDRFKVLGVIPYRDVTGLMKYSQAVINASLFEGWNTAVEESKSLGIPLILSDIPVHREQASSDACYFPPNDAKKLAECMMKIATGNPSQYKRVTVDSKVRMLIFAKEYQDIVLEIA